MARIIVAHTFTLVMLVSQLGLPLHMHYCKGMLESVSVFFSLGCDNHDEKHQAKAKMACCQKESVIGCSAENEDCCDDEVKLLTQELTSISPHFSKWVDIQILPTNRLFTLLPQILDTKTGSIALHFGTDSGPPIYLMQQALIFYG